MSQELKTLLEGSGMSRRIGDQEWCHHKDRLVIRRGQLIGLQTWVLKMIIGIDPIVYRVQKVQHKYGWYPFDWTRSRTLPSVGS
jgi:hypothetical protein